MAFEPKADTLDWIFFDVEIARDVEPHCTGATPRERRDEAFRQMRAGKGGMSVAVTWDTRTRDFELYDEATVGELADRLESFPVVAAFNHAFDVPVVEALAGRALALPHIVDPLMHVRGDDGKFLKGSRLSLLSEWNCGWPPKAGNGKDAYGLFERGEIAKLFRYCREDVARGRDLVYVMRDRGQLLGPNGMIELDLPPWVKELA